MVSESLHGGRQHYGTDRTRVESDSYMSKVQLDAARSDKVRQQATCRIGEEGGKGKGERRKKKLSVQSRCGQVYMQRNGG